MRIPCSNWSDCGVPRGGCCAAGVREKPSHEFCAVTCDRYDGPDRAVLRKMVAATLQPVWTPDQPSRGLGDTLAKLTHAVGISPCGGCLERQAAVNKLLPYGQ